MQHVIAGLIRAGRSVGLCRNISGHSSRCTAGSRKLAATKATSGLVQLQNQRPAAGALPDRLLCSVWVCEALSDSTLV